MYIYATLCIGACTALASCTHSRPHSFLQRRRARPARECRMWEIQYKEVVFLVLLYSNDPMARLILDKSLGCWIPFMILRRASLGCQMFALKFIQHTDLFSHASIQCLRALCFCQTYHAPIIFNHKIQLFVHLVMCTEDSQPALYCESHPSPNNAQFQHACPPPRLASPGDFRKPWFTQVKY